MNEEFTKIKESLSGISNNEIVSMADLRIRLKAKFGFAPTIATISKWSRNKQQPKITNLAFTLSGKVKSGIYYYPEVEEIMEKYYKQIMGRKKKI